MRGIPFQTSREKIPLLLESAVVRPLNFTGGVMALTLHVCLNPEDGARVIPSEMDLSPSLRLRIGAIGGAAATIR